MKAKFDNDAILLITEDSMSLDDLIELAHYYLQFLPIVNVDIKTTMLLENQRIKYYPVTEDDYNRFVETTKLVC